MARWLIFNFDGTWNGRDDESATNVLRFHRSLTKINQVPFFFAGPGNEDENGLIGQFLGGMFGTDCWNIRDAAYDTLKSVYQPGDRIAVTGFSRGAAIARLFCALVVEDGVNGYKPVIEFLGLWDTVFAAMPFGPFQQDTLFGDLHVSDKVVNARHALAIDEDRAAFEPNLMNARDGVVEMWFQGNHADIGGGYKERGLADITLRWMMHEAGGLGMQFEPLGDPDLPNKPHREAKPRRRNTRRVGVKVGDEWSKIPANIHVTAPGHSHGQ